MFTSYETRLRRDLLAWQERGLIDGGQRERIERDAFGRRGLAGLQAVLVLCLAILLIAATTAFVSANWAGMSPASRMVLLLGGNAAAVGLTFELTRRHLASPSPGLALAIDAAAALSLGLAILSIALVAQTFHLPSDPSGFARTIAALGLATALVARSRISAFIGAGALAFSAVDLPLFGATVPPMDGAGIFWLIAGGYLVTALGGWLPARVMSLFLVLVAMTFRLGAASALGWTFNVRAELIFFVALAAFASGHALIRTPSLPGGDRLRDGGGALVHAAAGLCLAAILAASIRTLGWTPRGANIWTLPALAAAAATGAILVLPWRAGRSPAPALADLVILGAMVFSLVLLVAGSGWGGTDRQASAFWTVWTGIVPALALVVAGHLDARRALYGWSLVLVGGLIVGLLFTSRDLIGFAGNLLGSAILVAATVWVCRWADRRLAGELT
jgi:uncharacterized membrane protein